MSKKRKIFTTEDMFTLTEAKHAAKAVEEESGQGWGPYFFEGMGERGEEAQELLESLSDSGRKELDRVLNQFVEHERDSLDDLSRLPSDDEDEDEEDERDEEQDEEQYMEWRENQLQIKERVELAIECDERLSKFLKE